MLTPDEVGQLVSAVIHALDERRDMTAEQHAADHRLVQEMAAERRERAELWRDLRKQLAKYGMIAVLSVLGTIGWYYFTHAVVGKVP